MFRSFILMSLIAFTSSSLAQKPVTVDLWPEGAPTDNGITVPEEEISLQRILNVKEATLTVYPAAKPNGLAIVICPGGGYSLLAMGHEGHDMAPWMNSLGITFAVLKYRMPNGHHDIPLSDAQEAIRFMRKNASKWGYKKIGIMGASAGSHLASTVATHADESSQPDFQVLLYPVISMQSGLRHEGSRVALLGKTPTKELDDLYSNELHVTETTPPAFIVHCTDDNGVTVKNSLVYYQALLAHKVPVSMFLYPKGGHGWGFWDTFPYKRQWTGELEKWLTEEILK